MSGPNPQPRVNITIDRLVLRGFPPGSQSMFTAAFEAELRRQVGASGTSFGPSRAVAALPMAPLRVSAAADMRATGVAAARQLIAGFRR